MKPSKETITPPKRKTKIMTKETNNMIANSQISA